MAIFAFLALCLSVSHVASLLLLLLLLLLLPAPLIERSSLSSWARAKAKSTAVGKSASPGPGRPPPSRMPGPRPGAAPMVPPAPPARSRLDELRSALLLPGEPSATAAAPLFAPLRKPTKHRASPAMQRRRRPARPPPVGLKRYGFTAIPELGTRTHGGALRGRILQTPKSVKTAELQETFYSRILLQL